MAKPGFDPFQVALVASLSRLWHNSRALIFLKEAVMSFVVRIRAWRARRNERKEQDALSLKERTVKDRARDDWASVKMGGEAGHWAEGSGDGSHSPR